MIAAAFLTSAINADKTLEVGNNAPKIETVEGINVVNDANSAGKTRLISFWSPKNPESRIANRNYSRIYGDTVSTDIEFISICTDSDEALMKEVMKIDGINASNNYAHSQISQRTFKDYGVVHNPRAFLVSPDGTIEKIL